MKVKQLKELLEKQDENLEVFLNKQKMSFSTLL